SHASFAPGCSSRDSPPKRAAGESGSHSPSESSRRITAARWRSRTRSEAPRSRLSFSDPPLALARFRMTLSMLLEETLIAGLNPAQREAVLHVNGPLLVLAGA